MVVEHDKGVEGKVFVEYMGMVAGKHVPHMVVVGNNMPHDLVHKIHYSFG